MFQEGTFQARKTKQKKLLRKFFPNFRKLIKLFRNQGKLDG